MCAALMLNRTRAMQWGHPWTSHSHKQQTPLAGLHRLSGTCRSLLCCLWNLVCKIKTGSSFHVGSDSLSFITSFIHPHLSTPFFLFILTSTFSSPSIFSAWAPLSLAVTLTSLSPAPFSPFSLSFSPQPVNLFWLQSEEAGRAKI